MSIIGDIWCLCTPQKINIVFLRNIIHARNDGLNANLAELLTVIFQIFTKIVLRNHDITMTCTFRFLVGLAYL